MTARASRLAPEPLAGPGHLPATFYLYTAALSGSRLGSLSVGFSLPWILYGRASPAIISVASASILVPYVASPWLARLPGRYDFRWLLLAFELIQAPATLAVYHLAVHRAYPLLIGCLLLASTAEAVSGLITDFYVLPYLAPGPLLARANGVVLGATQAAPLISPLLAGVLISHRSAFAIYVFNAASYLLTAGIAVVLVRRHPRPVRAGPVPTREAVAAIMRTRRLRRLTLSLVAYNLATGAVLLLIVLKAQHIWHWSAAGAGAVTTAAGALTAALAWLTGRRQRRPLRSLRIGVAVCAAGTVAVTAGGVAWVNITGLGVLCAGEGIVAVAQQTIRQTQIPRNVFGTVNGCMRAAMIAAVPAARMMLGGLTAVTSLTAAGAPFALLAVVAVIAALRCRGADPPEERT
jgi:MFS transporter